MLLVCKGMYVVYTYFSFASGERAYDVTAVRRCDVMVCCMHMDNLNDRTFQVSSISNRRLPLSMTK